MILVTKHSSVTIMLTIGLVCQVNLTISQKRGSPMSDSVKISRKSIFGIEMVAGILPKAHITRKEGSYVLHSRLQSSYDLGVLYAHRFNVSNKIVTGLHIVVGKRNYYAIVPAADFPPSMNITNELLIESKFTWSRFRIPFIFEKSLNNQKNRKTFNFSAGFDISFAFKSTFEGERHTVVGNNGQSLLVMDTDIESTNGGKPWLNYLFGISKTLDKKGHLSLGLDANISSAYFINGTYIFTVPGKPDTYGRYRISGSGFSLHVRYMLSR